MERVRHFITLDIGRNSCDVRLVIRSCFRCDSLKITDVLSWMENSPLGRLMPNKNNGIHLSTIKIAKFEVELWKGLENPKHLIDSGENLTLDHDKIHISYRSTWSSIKVNARIANVEDNNTSKAVAESCGKVSSLI